MRKSAIKRSDPTEEEEEEAKKKWGTLFAPIDEGIEPWAEAAIAEATGHQELGRRPDVTEATPMDAPRRRIQCRRHHSPLSLEEIVVATTDPLDRRQILRGELFHARSPPDGRPRPLPGKRRRHVHSLALPLRHLSSLMGIEHRRETGRR
ncbi:hypothetical protein B296_00040297 [Ensete ventricosum]|uniref:Uncharacterized protein n=1 Tax=Ensete ventricosum TaxID=4639 RepID=A0A426ZNF5_ENSVE|nr:hypothetical protein B296_00040297 [Ensete ventricosum]